MYIYIYEYANYKPIQMVAWEFQVAEWVSILQNFKTGVGVVKKLKMYCNFTHLYAYGCTLKKTTNENQNLIKMINLLITEFYILFLAFIICEINLSII